MTRNALPAPAIPETLDELTAEWVTSALRAGGALRNSRVAHVRAEVLGEGEGFVGLLARLHLTLEPLEPGAPATVIAKLPTTLELNRSLAEMMGAYERENRFYEELAASVPLRAPRCYFTAMDPNPLAGREERAIAWFRRIPMWLLRLLVPLLLWVGARSRRRYVLLLEDLAPARVGDQAEGCSVAEAERIVVELAAAQAALWNAPALTGRYWLADFEVSANVTQILFERNRTAFFAEYGSRLNDAVPPLADWLGRHGLELMQRLGSRPHTLIHGDFRLDNLLFDDRDDRDDRDDCDDCDDRPGGPRAWLTAIDWQGVGFGRGPFDLAYFLTGNVAADALVGEEERLVRAYYTELCRGGVAGYDFETCRSDYQLAKLFLLHRLISGAGMIDLSHERGQKILDRMFEGILATIPTRDLDALLRD